MALFLAKDERKRAGAQLKELGHMVDFADDRVPDVLKRGDLDCKQGAFGAQPLPPTANGNAPATTIDT